MIGQGRFGDAYLLKIWGFTVFLGPIISSLLTFIVFNKNAKIDQEFFFFIYIQIFVGLFLSIPSFLISEFVYKFLSKSNLSNREVFTYILIISLLSTLLTYLLFFGNADDYLIIFSSTYSIILIFGLFYFKKNDFETLN